MFNKSVIATLAVLPVLFTSVSAMAGDDMIERQVYQDKNYPAVQQKAVNMLRQRGYQVVDVEADDHFFKPALSVEAYKNNQEYDIKLSYPDLKILSERIDD
ncbi:PepSY domain-containing protein [Faucicola mancuniensis]|uniref:PepSY domain-containing protein n=1 Tax=Faucicola mancuniensis TaxID=1309795 RepID=UPI0028E6E9B7|nr:PepSY domain-containing protein [uncultured Moraxella sp.]